MGQRIGCSSVCSCVEGVQFVDRVLNFVESNGFSAG